MYTRDPVTPFELEDNHRDGIPVPSSLSGESMITKDLVAKMEHIYHSMPAKAHTNI